MASIKSRTGLRVWLFSCAFLVFAMVAVGGLTRLTRSGLSIVEWKPISGVIPPLNEEQWHREFEKYKQYPEYKKVNHAMDLSEFKFIYAWEFVHRLLGRLIGLVFAIPLIVFAWQGKLRGALAWKLWAALGLGGLQGFLGWYMVKSGLVDMPRVSHYRLAAHLLLALFIMGFLYWIYLDLGAQGRSSPPKTVATRAPALPRFRRWTRAFLALLSLQIFYGALTAGLHAGHMYNTFPLMHGQLIPQGIGSLGPIRDFFESPVTVQFMHRSLGWLVFFGALGLGLAAWRSQGLSSLQRKSLFTLAGMALVQFALGVATLLHAVPVGLGSLHQIGACVLLLLSIHAVYRFRTNQEPVAATEAAAEAKPLISTMGSARAQ